MLASYSAGSETRDHTLAQGFLALLAGAGSLVTAFQGTYDVSFVLAALACLLAYLAVLSRRRGRTEGIYFVTETRFIVELTEGILRLPLAQLEAIRCRYRAGGESSGQWYKIVFRSGDVFWLYAEGTASPFVREVSRISQVPITD